MTGSILNMNVALQPHRPAKPASAQTHTDHSTSTTLIPTGPEGRRRIIVKVELRVELSNSARVEYSFCKFSGMASPRQGVWDPRPTTRCDVRDAMGAHSPGRDLTRWSGGRSQGMPRARRHGCPADLTVAQWASIEPLLPPAASIGRREKHARRDSRRRDSVRRAQRVVAWRAPPSDHPPWQAVYHSSSGLTGSAPPARDLASTSGGQAGTTTTAATSRPSPLPTTGHCGFPSLLKTTFKALRNISLDPWKVSEIVAAALVLLHFDHGRTT